MKRFQVIQINKIRAAAIVFFLAVFASGLFYSLIIPGGAAVTTAQVRSTPRKQPSKTNKQKPAPSLTPTKTRFDHGIHQMECDSCHKFPSKNWEAVRKTEAFPDVTDYPRHESCLGCHREQFFSGARPTICTVCHTNPSPNDGTRHPFANPREIFDASPKGRAAVSDFQISFPHDKHIEIVSALKPERTLKGALLVNAGARRGGEESCAVCHQTYQPQGDASDEFVVKPPEKWSDKFWLKKGTFKTSPTSHATCFTCHSQDSGLSPAPTDCATCHKLLGGQKLLADFDEKLAAQIGVSDKIMLDAWRRRDASGTFRHEFFSHADMSCSSCHNAPKINTLDPLTKKVAITSCNNCHITATVGDGGALNYEIEQRRKDAKFECVKCHLAFGKAAIPASHTKAAADAQ